ncbi:hypothetical protein API480_66 [Paenibacillus phage vB_PlaP_API480]|uniref:Uncharacterized protein n=1 Tax=Paenibacillus larvae subsp. larvae TaxID=147375 RepID=A0A6C0QZG2_9BACL|nr:hypothetical protein [Paenibacillus larvae]QBX06352.1 hypothetical protein API480_66 [Paenibacillus phage vB_PlaP_API480]QHZ54062.1 hypothetical protein ERICV_05078 [Paenibacillus larvae subsp. larvae]
MRTIDGLILSDEWLEDAVCVQDENGVMIVTDNLDSYTLAKGISVFEPVAANSIDLSTVIVEPTLWVDCSSHKVDKKLYIIQAMRGHDLASALHYLGLESRDNWTVYPVTYKQLIDMLATGYDVIESYSSFVTKLEEQRLDVNDFTRKFKNIFGFDWREYGEFDIYSQGRWKVNNRILNFEVDEQNNIHGLVFKDHEFVEREMINHLKG